MSQIRLEMRVTNALPAPKIPEPFTEPVEITGHHFEGSNWIWDGTNIDLVRFEQCKTVSEQLLQLWENYAKKIMRPLQAGELKQMERHIDIWPANWGDRVGGGRIFFAGTIYTVSYSNSMHHDLIWYAAFDKEHNDWQFDCLPVSTQLRVTDCFACVSIRRNKLIPDYPVWPAIPAWRPPFQSVRGRESFKGR